MSTNLNKKQQGFTIISVLLLAIIIAVVYFAARFVSSANEDNKRQADKLSESVYGGEQTGDPDDYEIPEKPSDRQEFSIRSISINLEVYYIQLVAKLPGTFTGTCRAEVQRPDGENYHRFVEEIENASSCIISIPRTELTSSKNWKFQMSFASHDGKIVGKHPESTFSL